MIKFLVNSGCRYPKRADGDAGFDFYIPKYSEELAKTLTVTPDRKIIIRPHEDVLIPTGVRSLLPSNIALIANNKSGIATKKRLAVGACVVDSSYQGIIHIHVYNTSDKPVVLEFDTKLCQFVPLYIDDEQPDIVEIPVGLTDEEQEQFIKNFYKDTVSHRGAGGFGSTGLK